ncbi:zf-CCHC domain-containing protein/UBN2 domain-containing protein, partial [Cephalotus follicularis]
HDYEMFTMNENEDIKSMFSRFTNIINALQALDKIYSNSEMVRKILRCLPRFKKYLAKKKFGNKHFKKTFPSKSETKKEEIVCFECNKPGHYKSECPRLNKAKDTIKKKKAMLATWSDSDESSCEEVEDQEVAQIALMAINDSDQDEDENEDENEVSELLEKFSFENASLQKTIKSLNKENVSLKHE